MYRYSIINEDFKINYAGSLTAQYSTEKKNGISSRRSRDDMPILTKHGHIWNDINAFIHYFSLKKNAFSLKRNHFSLKKNAFSLKKID